MPMLDIVDSEHIIYPLPMGNGQDRHVYPGSTVLHNPQYGIERTTADPYNQVEQLSQPLDTSSQFQATKWLGGVAAIVLTVTIALVCVAGVFYFMGAAGNLGVPDMGNPMDNIINPPPDPGPAPGPGGCFAPSTPVWTPDGMVPISEIKAGDKVFSMDTDTGEMKTSTVTKIFSTTRSGIVKVETKTNSVVCSNNHRYLTDEGEWKEISHINGDSVKTANGPTKVKVTSINGEMKVHNLEVKGTRNYFVGNSKLLVHNRKLREWEWP
jgi:hypothetical protein